MCKNQKILAKLLSIRKYAPFKSRYSNKAVRNSNRTATEYHYSSPYKIKYSNQIKLVNYLKLTR